MKQANNTVGRLIITGGDTARTSRFVSMAEKAAERAAQSAAAAEEAVTDAASAAADFLNQADQTSRQMEMFEASARQSAAAAGNAQTAAETAAQSVSQSAAQISQNASDISDLKSAFYSTLDDTNLFDKDTVTDGKRLGTTGSPVTATDYFVSAFIPVAAGKTYIKNSPTEDGYHRLCVYDSSNRFIPNAAYSSNLVTIPAGGVSVRFCGEISEKETATLILVSPKDVQAREDIDELSAQKMDKPKTYTAISGTFHEGAMWKYSTSEEVSNSSYIYAVITSGFTAGETYAFDAYQPSSTNVYAAIAFYNSNNQLIDKVVLSSSASAVKYEVLVPENTTAIYINAIKSRGFPGMYAFSYSDADIYGIVASNEFSASNWMDRRYQDGEFEQYTAKTPDHLVVTFSVDDSYPDISDIATAFATAGVPICLATIPEYLDVVCNNGDTVLEVCQDVQSRGGEILTHNHYVIGANSTPEQYLKYFVTSKKALVDAGLTVNGIIKAGGTEPGGAPNISTMLRYLRSYYDYGTGFSTVGDGRFTIARGRLKADTDFDAIKAQIDAASSGGIKNFYTHGQADFPGDSAWVDKIMDLVNYILSKPNAEIVTIGDMFRNNYAKSFKS